MKQIVSGLCLCSLLGSACDALLEWFQLLQTIPKCPLKTYFWYLLGYFCICCCFGKPWIGCLVIHPGSIITSFVKSLLCLQTEFILKSICSDSNLPKILWLYFSYYFWFLKKSFSSVFDSNSLTNIGCILFTFYTKILSQDLALPMHITGNS